MLTIIACMDLIFASCNEDPTDSECRQVERLANLDSVAVLNEARVGEELQVRIARWLGYCDDIIRIERASHGDTILLSLIVETPDSFNGCPPCVPGLLEFADTVGVPTQEPGTLWVRAKNPQTRPVVDSTVVLP